MQRLRQVSAAYEAIVESVGVPLRRLDVRLGRLPVAAGALVLFEAVVRLAVREPYPGATALLLVACGIALLPLLPAAIRTHSVRLAILPPLALVSFAILLTTVSIAGIRLGELSIRVSVGLLVAALAVGGALIRPLPAPAHTGARSEAAALVALVAIVAVSLASALVILRPFPPPGSDWGHYLLYADEVASQGHLLIENPYTVGEARLFGNYPGVGAVYGSLRILDGISSESLALGLAVASALVPLAAYAAVGTLWGSVAGLVAAAAFAVAPIRLEPVYWHGLATTAGLLVIPLVLLALALAYRGERDARTVGLLGVALAGALVAHSVSAFVVGVTLAVVVVADAGRWAVTARAGGARRVVRRWWHEGMTRPVAAGVAIGGVLGAGVVVHMRRQAEDLGPSLGYEHFGPASVGIGTFIDYYTWSFAALGAAGVALVAASSRVRRDPALSAFAALAVAALLVSQLWRLHVAFDYRRAVYYVAIPAVAAVGLAVATRAHRWLALAAAALALAYIAHLSFGLRLPQRVASPTRESPPVAEGLRSFAGMLERERAAGTLLVADSCLGAVVPYMVRRPTLIAAAEWQVGFQRLLPPARTAVSIVEGGSRGRRLAGELGVDYVLVDPRCTPGAAERLDGVIVLERPGLAVVELPARSSSVSR